VTLAALIARAGCAVIRALVALHPADFRTSFGATVIDETEAEIAGRGGRRHGGDDGQRGARAGRRRTWPAG
jgi:hypothetical protein